MIPRIAGENRLRTDMSPVGERFGDLVACEGNVPAIRPEGRALARMLATVFDRHAPQGVRCSQAS
ncbi:hypothetical protein [Salipiger sp.]|uniref:hypothetical protein n=1 Tax=Salipiger sp. TaxID=2078585 RepID=UPI003A96967B